ncbi:MAG: hopanoid biosynthesis-associated protein HpnK [Verrucomicrobia bacterium]|nr:hopanoid biosynthesis-associated protein HpnK [Verrucomicrobiota bacterium]MCF7707662.1 hopanoid biosynthesis-associated protein HpnK [Verrucomicrobiota bacterium]
MARMHDNKGVSLIVNADDFGKSSSVNQAVELAHCRGILTTASLMVNGDAAMEAVEIARRNPGLGVGLHLTLACGRPALERSQIPGLVGDDGSFDDKPVLAGLRYFANPALAPQLESEVSAQFEKFEATGLKLDHVNGHLNIHLHPVILRILLRNAERRRIKAVRLTREPLMLNLRISGGHYFYRLSHALIFGLLARYARKRLGQACIKYANAVFGLLQTGRVDSEYLGRLLSVIHRVPGRVLEFYAHPCMETARNEFSALTDTRVIEKIKTLDIGLIRYQDLTHG